MLLSNPSIHLRRLKLFTIPTPSLATHPHLSFSVEVRQTVLQHESRSSCLTYMTSSPLSTFPASDPPTVPRMLYSTLPTLQMILSPHACGLPVFLLTAEGRRSPPVSPLLPVPRQPWTPCHCSVWPVLDIICPSSPRPSSSSLTNKFPFQYSNAKVSVSDHMTEILELT